MRISFFAALAAVSLLACPLGAQAQMQHHAAPAPSAPSPTASRDYTLGALKISTPWTRATPKGARVAGGFLKITNTGSAPDRLIGGSFPLAGKFEVHEMATVDGVMKMRHLPQGIEIKPGETMELKPGSYHVMFMELKEPLVTGKPIKGTLIFEKAGTIEIEYDVAPVGAPGPAAGHGQH